MRRAMILICFCLLIPLAGCRGASPARISRWNTPFSADIIGWRNGLPFSARLEVSAGEKTIRYTAPASLNGLTATETADGIRVSFGAMVPAERGDVSGLLVPLRLLTDPAPLASAQVRNGETVLTYEDGTEIVLDPSGVPREATRTDLRFTVSDWDS